MTESNEFQSTGPEPLPCPASKLLVVDDKPENLFAMQQLLRGCGADLYMASSGQEALALTLRHEFALILMDVQMPDMDGFETASLIRQDEQIRHIPIIFVTALQTELHYVFQGYQAGAVDYLLKPVNADILLSKVRVFLALDRYQHQLAGVNRQQQLLLECAAEGILGISPQGQIRFANPAAASILGCSPAGLHGQSLMTILPSAPAGEPPLTWEDSPIHAAYLQGEPLRVTDACLLTRAGNPVSVEYTSAPLRGDDGEFLGGVILFQDITQRKQTEQRLLELAQYDPLTGLANRKLFQDALHRCLAGARRRRRNVAILLLDLDHFKNVNDTLGHDAGDRLLQSVASRLRISLSDEAPAVESLQETQLLQSVAQRLQSNLRSSDLVARLGGDEFAVVLDDLAQPAHAGLVAERILQALAPPHKLGNCEVFISPSIGIATFPECGAEAADLLRAADTALYQAKARGRNNYQFYAPDMHQAFVERLRLETDLRHAIEREQLALRFLPRRDLGTGQLIGVEAELCWQHPELGSIGPGRFLPLAEQTGGMAAIGDWSLAQLCRQLALWQAQGLWSAGMRLGISLSSHQLLHTPFCEQLPAALAAHGLAPALIELELNEAAIVTRMDTAVERLQGLRQAGFRVILCDFGAGSSALLQLADFPIDGLKMAPSVVSQIGAGPRQEALLRSLIRLAADLGLALQAEGVTSARQQAFLLANGCRRAQGPHIGLPLSPGELASCLQARAADRCHAHVD